jgi:ankyrin repeat protein
VERKKGEAMEKNPLEINFTNFWGFQKSDNSLLDEFFEAVISSDIQKVKEILDVRKDIVNLEKEGWTALTIASWNGDKEMVKLLIENGADISMKNKYGKTALMLALEGGHKEVVELLKSYETKEEQ